MSFELDRSMGDLPPACNDDVPYEGVADVVVMSEEGDIPRIQLSGDKTVDGEVLPGELWPMLTLKSLSIPPITTLDLAVRGFVIDNDFVMASASEAALARGITARSDINFARGTKSVLIILACRSDDEDCAGAFLPPQSAGGGIANNGGIVGYMQECMSFANDFFGASSWGQFALQPTVPEPVRLSSFSISQCGTATLGRYSTSAPNNGKVDFLAIAAMSEQRGIDVNDFDFFAVVLPGCSSLGWTGLGWVGAVGLLLNLRYTYGYDPSFVHELGHNLGLNHGTTFTSGYRGRRIFETNFVDSGDPSPDGFSAYGSPVTLMGGGGTPDGARLSSATLFVCELQNCHTLARSRHAP